MSKELPATQTTTCCIVGGGPGGAMLALLLARKGVAVKLLEMHEDFDRDFRGDTVHPSTMEILDEIGLAAKLHELPHNKMQQVTLRTTEGDGLSVDLSFLNTKFAYIMMLPQARFLEFVTQEAARYPHFELIMGAHVEELIEKDGTVQGVRYQDKNKHWREIRAALTVGADGRSSRVRRLAGFEAVKTAPPMDVLWFRLPRVASDGSGLGGRIGRGRLIVMLDRDAEWQIGYIIPKGSYQKLRTDGIETLQRGIAELEPKLSDRVAQLQDWKQVALLSVESSRVPRWHRPGLLLIGDAAHVMSPVGGVGINYAVQDAVVASNILAAPLKNGTLSDNDLARVQRARKWPTRFIQTFQAQIQKRVIAGALSGGKPFRVPFFARWKLFQRLPARLIAFGLRRVHVED